MSRNTIPFNSSNDDSTNRLNIGCGRHFHSDWTNLDLQSNDPSVICHDVTQGVPFSEDSFHVVYHSHILEHLSPEQGVDLIGECYRVLRPGGILRIVVPDLEEIVQLYLAMHEQAWKGNDRAQVNYHWMKMELLDQMVRSQSGGMMGRYMAGLTDEEADFVQSRIGSEFQLCRAPDLEPNEEKQDGPVWSRLLGSLANLKTSAAKQLVKMLMGATAHRAFVESLFRGQGEIHRWMYDRYSLRELCHEAGFVDFQIMSAFESQIEDYSIFHMDSIGKRIRKPDSLFVECQKPALSMKASA